MSILQIAWKSLRQRWLSSSLTALSIALGVALLVGVLVTLGIITRLFSQTGAGYDLLIGARGSRTQLVLSSIYRVERPNENLPYRFYKQLQDDPRIDVVVPLTIGDNTDKGNFPIVGTTTRYFTLPAARRDGKPVEFRIKGKPMATKWDAVIGSEVARTNGWDVGSTFQLIHAGQVDHVHEEKFTVTGVLEPTGTPNDRTAFVALAGFLSLADHLKPIDEAIEYEAQFFDESPEQTRAMYQEKIDKLVWHGNHWDGVLPDLMKEVTALLVITKREEDLRSLAGQLRANELQSEINSSQKALAVVPTGVMSELTRKIIGPADLIAKFVGGIITVVTAIGVFVSIYNSMSDRRREIGIMRALGARRGTVMGIILAESALLCLVGGALGLLLGHGLVFVAAPILLDRAGILIDPLAFESTELLVFPVLLVLGVLVGLLPGLTAYRTDVATALEQ